MVHIDYHVVLDQGRTVTDRCPLCAFLDAAEHRFLDSMLDSWVGTEGFQNRFLEHDGFCPRHAAHFAARGDGVAAAMLYGPLLTHRRRWIEELEEPPVHRFLRQTARRLLRRRRAASPADRGRVAPRCACPLCTQAEQWEHSFLGNLVRHTSLRGPETKEAGALREAWCAGTGLCLPHYRQLVTRHGEPAPWLRDLHHRRMDHLHHGIETFLQDVSAGRHIASGAPWRDLLTFMEGFRKY